MATDVLGRDIGIGDDGDIQFSSGQDFLVVTGRTNLRQAIRNRINTFLGEYYITAYGSELNKVVGKPRDNTTLVRMRGFIIEALKQEPRISTVDSVKLSFDEDDERKINSEIVVTPIESTTPLNLVFDLFI